MKVARHYLLGVEPISGLLLAKPAPVMQTTQNERKAVCFEFSMRTESWLKHWKEVVLGQCYREDTLQPTDSLQSLKILLIFGW